MPYSRCELRVTRQLQRWTFFTAAQLHVYTTRIYCAVKAVSFSILSVCIVANNNTGCRCWNMTRCKTISKTVLAAIDEPCPSFLTPRDPFTAPDVSFSSATVSRRIRKLSLLLCFAITLVCIQSSMGLNCRIFTTSDVWRSQTQNDVRHYRSFKPGRDVATGKKIASCSRTVLVVFPFTSSGE